jgi:hypothetical protein
VDLVGAVELTQRDLERLAAASVTLCLDPSVEAPGAAGRGHEGGPRGDALLRIGVVQQGSHGLPAVEQTMGVRVDLVGAVELTQRDLERLAAASVTLCLDPSRRPSRRCAAADRGGAAGLARPPSRRAERRPCPRPVHAHAMGVRVDLVGAVELTQRDLERLAAASVTLWDPGTA